jgi:Ribbon-helix-helix protein, copG family
LKSPIPMKSKPKPVLLGLPPELVEAIDKLAERELLSRSSWMRRELVLAVRASRHDEQAA